MRHLILLSIIVLFAFTAVLIGDAIADDSVYLKDGLSQQD